MIRLVPLFLSIFLAGGAAVATQDSAQHAATVEAQQEVQMEAFIDSSFDSTVDMGTASSILLTNDGFIGIMR